MNIKLRNRKKLQEGALLIPYFILLVITATAIASLGAFVSQSGNIADRRNNMTAAVQFAQGGAVVACSDLNTVFTNSKGNSNSRMVAKGYTKNNGLSDPKNTVYQRTITAPFTSQSVAVQIWLPKTNSPTSARIVASATSGNVTQTATVNVKMAWSYPAAIISVNPGTSDTSISKSTAQNGNVVVNGSSAGRTIVDGGSGKAILANGQVNIDTTYAVVPANTISKTNYGSANEIPDYTAQGTANTLFDFARFIAIADLTTNSLNPKGNNHFTNMTTFITAANRAFTNAAKALEGVIVVDVAGNDNASGNLDSSHLPNGINVKGTLFFNFDSSFGPLDKIKNTADMNVNPANLAGLVATNPATYTSGYPPVYYDPTKNPTNINITSKGFQNVTDDEDLPAMMYSIGVLDMHGNVNISGVVYTPSNFEIENKANGQIQYFKGSLISGLGCYFENNQTATSIISFDPNAIDSLATLGNAGKAVQVAYWE